MFNFIRNILKNSLVRNIEPYEITIEELKSKQKNGAEIIDVRSMCEYNEEHLRGAVNIPEYEINSNFQNLYQNKEKEIILYCSSGKRSRTAYKKLKSMGYKNVYSLYGGIEN